MNEINPENAVTRTLHDNWHKIVAVMLHKLKLTELEITPADIRSLELAYPHGMPCVLADARNGKFIVKIVTEEEARRLAKAH